MGGCPARFLGASSSLPSDLGVVSMTYAPGPRRLDITVDQDLDPASNPDPARFKVTNAGLRYTGNATLVYTPRVFRVTFPTSIVTDLGPEDASYLAGTGDVLALSGAKLPTFVNQPYT